MISFLSVQDKDIMRIDIIHLDDALINQYDFSDKYMSANAHVTDLRKVGAAIRLWGYDSDLNTLKSSLEPCSEPTLTFMGSGDFHHVTALLLERLAESQTQPFTVVHFDNHPDWVRFSGGMHCGSWVERAVKIQKVSKVITLGVCSNDLQWPEFKGANLGLMKTGRIELFPSNHPPSYVLQNYGKGAGYEQKGHCIKWNTLENHTLPDFCSLLLSRINTESIYITIDKDVLCYEEAITNWDQGNMRLNDVVFIINQLAQHHRITGADVIGDYSHKSYSGSSGNIIMKHAEAWLDQPHAKHNLEDIDMLNSLSNTTLLKTFQGIMI